MSQAPRVAITDSLKIELESIEAGNYHFNVYTLENGTWEYLDSAETTLPANCSEGKLYKLLTQLADTYTSGIQNGLFPSLKRAALITDVE